MTCVIKVLKYTTNHMSYMYLDYLPKMWIIFFFVKHTNMNFIIALVKKNVIFDIIFRNLNWKTLEIKIVQKEEQSSELS